MSRVKLEANKKDRELLNKASDSTKKYLSKFFFSYVDSQQKMYYYATNNW